ncbi:MAG: hypothetical protein AABO58_22425 [Acidobacteriota bacterium]
MASPVLSIFGGVLEGEGINTEDDFAHGKLFFAVATQRGVYGGCVRVKQIVGTRVGEQPLEIGPPLAYDGPPLDQQLLADIVRWYWLGTRAEVLESVIGGSKNLPGSFIGVTLATNLTRQVSLPFDREWFNRFQESSEAGAT